MNPEFGWCEIALDRSGPRGSGSVGLLPPSFEIFEWHSDTFTLPKDAELLASSAIAPVQSFRIGRAGYATQFHFEASRKVVQAWARGFPDLMEQENPGFVAQLPDLAAEHGVRSDANGLAIARAWVALI